MPTKTATADAGTVLTPASSRMLGTPFHLEAFGPPFAKWYSKREGVSLAATELRGEVEHSRSFELDAGESPNRVHRQFSEILRQERAVKESGWLLIVSGCAIVPNVIQMNCKFGCIQRTPISQVFAGVTTLYQGLSAI